MASSSNPAATSPSRARRAAARPIWIYLPQGRCRDRPGRGPADFRISRKAGHGTILVVEDDPLVRSLCRSPKSSSLGYTHALGRQRPGSAVRAARVRSRSTCCSPTSSCPARSTGASFRSKRLKLRPALKVLFTSGYTENAIDHDGRLDPGVLLLAKPYSRADLARMIRLAMRVDHGTIPGEPWRDSLHAPPAHLHAALRARFAISFKAPYLLISGAIGPQRRIQSEISMTTGYAARPHCACDRRLARHRRRNLEGAGSGRRRGCRQLSRARRRSEQDWSKSIAKANGRAVAIRADVSQADAVAQWSSASNPNLGRSTFWSTTPALRSPAELTTLGSGFRPNDRDQSEVGVPVHPGGLADDAGRSAGAASSTSPRARPGAPAPSDLTTMRRRPASRD